MELNELRYNVNDFNGLDLGDMIIVFKGYIWPIFTHRTDDDNIEYCRQVLLMLCKTFSGMYDTFFENDGNLKPIFIKHLDDAFYNFVDRPKILVGEIIEGDNGLAIDFLSDEYDIRNSKELFAFVRSKVASDYEIFLNGEEVENDMPQNKKDLQNIPLVKYAYHGTSTRFVAEILTKGLRSKSENSAWGIHNDGYVFLTGDYNVAKDYAAHATKKGGWKAILKINTDYIDRNKIVLDYDFVVSYTSDYKDSPYDVSDKNRTAQYKGNITTNQTANGSKYGKFGYKGIIMPNAIEGVYIFSDLNNFKYYTREDYLRSLKSNNESIDRDYINEVDSSEISLKSFEIQDELHPKFWVNNKLNSRVRLRLLDIADDFLDELAIRWVKPKDIVFTGSLANYNWSKYSDIDLHILIDYNDVYDKKELVEDYFDSKKELWTETHSFLKIYGFPVEIYVEDASSTNKSSGVYSLNKNEWIKEPDDFQNAKLSEKYIKDFSAKVMTEIDDIKKKLDKTADEHKVDVLSTKMRNVFNKLKNMRKEGLKSKQKEMSSGNIIWKVIRRSGYLDKIWDVINKSYDRINSLK